MQNLVSVSPVRTVSLCQFAQCTVSLHEYDCWKYKRWKSGLEAGFWALRWLRVFNRGRDVEGNWLLFASFPFLTKKVISWYRHSVYVAECIHSNSRSELSVVSHSQWRHYISLDCCSVWLILSRLVSSQIRMSSSTFSRRTRNWSPRNVCNLNSFFRNLPVC
jgi:hypothetical protein